MENNLIVVKQLPIIEDQLRQVKTSVDERVAQVLALACTEATYKDVKKARAELNKEFQDLEARRREVKKAILAPYEAFEKLYKECAADAFTKADAELKAKIASVENGIKGAKREEIVAFYNEYRASLNIPEDIAPFDRCGITCAVAVENDATQHNSDWPTFDRVLCDVPCSGLGVIAKKPDIRYKDLDGIENLLAAQQKILQNGADSLAENGRLVYSTCTVNDKENQAQVEKFLSANPDFHVVLPKTALPGADITPLGTLFLPHRTGTDGFFAAILERN